MSEPGTLNLRDIWQPLHSNGAPFFGVLRTAAAIDEWPMDINPDYQRGHVWTERQQELFLGHLFEGGEVNPVIINTGPKGDWPVAEIVDGKQRVTACIRWSQGEVPAELWNGRRFFRHEIDAQSERLCKTVIGLRYATVRLTRTQCLELYIRLNRGGTPHTEAEVDRVRQLLAAEQAKGNK